jgi:hypothetical protein
MYLFRAKGDLETRMGLVCLLNTIRYIFFGIRKTLVDSMLILVVHVQKDYTRSCVAQVEFGTHIIGMMTCRSLSPCSVTLKHERARAET